MTIEEMEKRIIKLEEKYSDLEYKYLKLREWSDDNDFWLREMIDALTESVDKNTDKIAENQRVIKKIL
jgi:hypothetical protein